MAAVALAALAACLFGGCAATGGAATHAAAPAMTDSGFPASLGLKENRSPVARNLAAVFDRIFAPCRATFAVFTEGARTPGPVSDGTGTFTQAYADTATCRSTASATAEFRHVVASVTKVGATAVAGLGSSAFEAQTHGQGASVHIVFWRDGSVLGFLQLSGPSANRLITARETQALARRQMAGP